jgi:hypothetical protein
MVTTKKEGRLSVPPRRISPHAQSTLYLVYAISLYLSIPNSINFLYAVFTPCLRLLCEGTSNPRDRPRCYGETLLFSRLSLVLCNPSRDNFNGIAIWIHHPCGA